MAHFYFLTSSLSPLPHYEQVEAALHGGARIIQYRDKESSKKEMIENALRMRSLCATCGVPFFVNDNLDVARETSSGLHIGIEDFDPMKTKESLGRLPLGISTHSPEQARYIESLGVASYISIGPIFASRTKPERQPVGLEALKATRKLVRSKLVAIGGITLGSVQEIISAGADAVVAISAVHDEPNLEAAVRKWCNAVH